MADHSLSIGEKVRKFFELEPAILRGILVALAAIIAKIIGAAFIDDVTVDLIIDLFSSISAFIAVVWVRPAVTANAKVLAFKPKPDEAVILPGAATIESPAELQAAIIAVEALPPLADAA